MFKRLYRKYNWKFAKKLMGFEKAGEAVLQVQAEAVQALQTDEHKEKEEHAKRLRFLQDPAALKQKHLGKKRDKNAKKIEVLREECEQKKTKAMIVTTRKLGVAEPWQGPVEPRAQLIGAVGCGPKPVCVVTS